MHENLSQSKLYPDPLHLYPKYFNIVEHHSGVSGDGRTRRRHEEGEMTRNHSSSGCFHEHDYGLTNHNARKGTDSHDSGLLMGCDPVSLHLSMEGGPQLSCMVDAEAQNKLTTNSFQIQSEGWCNVLLWFYLSTSLAQTKKKRKAGRKREKERGEEERRERHRGN